MNDLSHTKVRTITRTLLLLMPIVGMAVDLIAPSLPAIAINLHASSQFAKNVIAIYLLGYALGNFVTGFVTDAWGRKKLLVMSLTLFIIASLLPITLPNILVLLMTRLFQGIALGAAAVIIRAIIADIHKPAQLVQLGTLIGTMWGLGPILGPFIGGYLQHYYGWQSGFYFFAICAAIILLLTLWLVPETHYSRQMLNIKTIQSNLIEILSHRLFMSLVVLMGLAYSLIIVFNTLGPFLIQNVLHKSAIFYGHIALCLGIIFLCATFICRQLLKKTNAIFLLKVIINILIILTIILIIFSYTFTTGVAIITGTSAIMFFSTGFIFPMSMGKGMSLFRHIAGTAGATMYLINVLITSLVSFIVSFISVQSFAALMTIYFILIVGFWFVYWFSINRCESKPTSGY